MSKKHKTATQTKKDLSGSYCCLRSFVADGVAYKQGDCIEIKVLGLHRVIVAGDTVESAEWSLSDLNRVLKNSYIKG